MLNLLFGEEPGEGDDVRVDFFARVGHGGGYDAMKERGLGESFDFYGWKSFFGFGGLINDGN